MFLCYLVFFFSTKYDSELITLSIISLFEAFDVVLTDSLLLSSHNIWASTRDFGINYSWAKASFNSACWVIFMLLISSADFFQN